MPDFKLHEAFQEPGAEGFRSRGNEAFRQQEWDEAIEYYNKAIGLDPTQAALYSNRAACWSSKGEHEKALADAEMCTERDPTFVKGHSRKGRALFSLQRLDEAEAAFKVGLTIDPQSEVCLRGLHDVQAARPQEAGARVGCDMGVWKAFFRGIRASLRKYGMWQRLAAYAACALIFPLAQVLMHYMDLASEGAAPRPTLELQRGFALVHGGWLSYLEAGSVAQAPTLLSSLFDVSTVLEGLGLEGLSADASMPRGAHSLPTFGGKAERGPLLLLLHSGGLSAEAELGGLLRRLVARAKNEPPPGLRLLAPDRPGHGYSPLGPHGADRMQGDAGAAPAWLRGLLAAVPAERRLVLVASGREAALQALALATERRGAAQLLLLLPGPASGAASGPTSVPGSAEEVRAWFREQPGNVSALEAADALHWMMVTSRAKDAEEEPAEETKAAALPKGRKVLVLYCKENGEEGAEPLRRDLKGRGITATVQKSSSADELWLDATQRAWEAVVNEEEPAAAAEAETEVEEDEEEPAYWLERVVRR